MDLPDKSLSAGHVDRTRPIINSYDIFDTLIARSCAEPGYIFEHVERKLNAEGFARARRQAEDAVAARGEYVFEDIYAEIRSTQKEVPADVIERLKQAEIDAEIEHVIPIADNIAKVQDGDILVSDMYLGEAVIRRMLQKGFDKKVGLYVSSHGKASGSVWPKILKEFRIGSHLGDNVRSDVQVPRSLSINARHTAISALNQIEGELVQAGLRNLALLCRESRLTTPTEDHVTRRLLDVQTSFNFPMLVMAALR
jgi:predicted HAD superfamily hydrolase